MCLICHTSPVFMPLTPADDFSAQGVLTPFLCSLASFHLSGLSFPIWITIILIPDYWDWPLNWSSHPLKRPFLITPSKSTSWLYSMTALLCFLVRFLAIYASVCISSWPHYKLTGDQKPYLFQLPLYPQQITKSLLFTRCRTHSCWINK